MPASIPMEPVAEPQEPQSIDRIEEPVPISHEAVDISAHLKNVLIEIAPQEKKHILIFP